ncbi:DMT family transporter [Crenobacter cavernae]|uniref:DMT family transporter n=1 Tax=Crenobacter cavernae TaxID=2290923 RepID=A0ABY0FCQ3_9NEIS|nr:DMT family transporter [Crenobacter cavernae]RXZ43820.1 DMT family transporter [Crenobacter cavernae]
MRDALTLVVLAALWGASFLFMRVAAPAFGPFALVWLRLALAGAILVPLIVWQGGAPAWRANARPIFIVGVINSALPFCLISWATLTLPAGIASVLNATTPLMTALWAMPLAGERLSAQRLAGLGLGLAGVAVLAMGKIDGSAAGVLPVLAMLAATASYGLAAHYARRELTGVPPLVVSGGSLASTSLPLAPLALWTWPATMPGAIEWGVVLALAALSTALAYLLYYRLIASLGATRASAVTYLIPLFGVLWGAWLLGEPVGLSMLAGGALILAGVGFLQYKRLANVGRTGAEKAGS